MKKLDKFERMELTETWFPVHPTTQKPLSISCEDGTLIPIFSTKEKYAEAAKWGGFQFAHCQKILNYNQFFSSLMEAKTKFEFRLILDPHIVEGRLRFQLIPLDDSDVEVIKNS